LVECWLKPPPVESLVKNPIPCALASCLLPSSARAFEVNNKTIPKTAPANNLHFMFLLSP
jgi:hypothetical protein